MGIAKLSIVQGEMGGCSGWLRSDAAAKGVPPPLLLPKRRHWRRAMPAITCPHHFRRSPLGRALAALAGRAGRGLQADRRADQEPPGRDASRRARRPHAGRHRHHPQRPARRLFGAPWRDPSELLARRATERRVRRRRVELTCAVQHRKQTGAVRRAAGPLLSAGRPSGALPGLKSRVRRLGLLDCLGRSSHRPTSGPAVPLPPRMLRPPPPGGRILFRLVGKLPSPNALATACRLY